MEADTNESYVVTYTGIEDKDADSTGLQFTLADDTSVTVTNTLNDIAPTGLALRFLPWIIIVCAGAGLLLVVRKRRRL